MNKKFIFVLATVLSILMYIGNACVVDAAQCGTLKVKMVSVSSKQIRFRFVLKDKEYAYYPRDGQFTLKKFVPRKNKWRKLLFCDVFPVAHSHQMIMRGTTNKTIKWKYYYGMNLPKGRYKFRWGKTYRFVIK